MEQKQRVILLSIRLNITLKTNKVFMLQKFIQLDKFLILHSHSGQQFLRSNETSPITYVEYLLYQHNKKHTE